MGRLDRLDRLVNREHRDRQDLLGIKVPPATLDSQALQVQLGSRDLAVFPVHRVV